MTINNYVATEVVAGSNVSVTQSGATYTISATGGGGSGGNANTFVFTQSSPASTWVINHGLNSPVGVTILSTGGVIVDSDVVEGSLNQVTVTFAQPFAGSAVVTS